MAIIKGGGGGEGGQSSFANMSEKRLELNNSNKD